ncbi:MAG TPA: prepilin-type N-terminal cleavage/methylation domain-containing protein [Terriglobales bacterium]|nr:prepilin-type N-terminal cleavage/methylation domain-containing protein [Terriglobales bacterium]
MGTKNSNRGFTMTEMLIGMAVGLVVLGGAAQVFKSALSSTWVTSQRAELQQDFRAASDLLTKDISLAGAGLGDIGIPLPSGSGTLPVYGCDQAAKCYINNTAVAYPQATAGNPVLYGLIPGYQLGPKINGQQTDILTVAYTDNNFLLNCYNVSVTDSTHATFTLPSPLPATCVLPPNLVTPQPVNDAVVGLTPGDLVWLQVTKSTTSGGVTTSVSGMAVGEVTNVISGGANTYTVTFAAADVLKMNQPTANNSIGKIVGYSASNGAYRILVITYYIDTWNAIPRLMRMVNGHTPVPVAENTSLLNFSYDLYANNTQYSNQNDGGASYGFSPKLITKVNILHMTMRSQIPGTSGYQGFDLQTSMGVRNLTFTNSYPQ